MFPEAPPVIAFLSDYGVTDAFVGICHGVIASACPAAKVIDLTHGVRRQDVRQGAFLLAQALPYAPVGVALAVVDPDVGARRRAVALRLADRRLLVGPDNGLLSLAAQLGGGVVEAVDIARSPVRLEPVSATFHGRDIFAPVAAALASGEPLALLGEPLDPATLVTLAWKGAEIKAGALIAAVRYIDGFGNASLNAGHEDLARIGVELGGLAELELPSGQRRPIHYARTFADVARGELLLFQDAQRLLAVAVGHGDASALLGVQLDDELRIRP